MSRNGKRAPARPRIELSYGSASQEEAAAITAAIEQFLRDTAPAPAARARPVDSWKRAALFEGAGLACDAPSPWGDDEPWGNSGSR
jgi:hypothetical protein